MLPCSLRRRHADIRHPATEPTIHVLRAALGVSLSNEALAALAPFADLVEVGPGTPLARAGVIPRQLTVLVEGRALVQPNDGERWIAGPGARFGEQELRAGHALRLSATTIGPSARILVVFGPAVGWAVAGLLAGQG